MLAAQEDRSSRQGFTGAVVVGKDLLELLSSRYGIDESRLSVQSYGSNDPKSSNDTPDGRAINRRVEIIILEKP